MPAAGDANNERTDRFGVAHLAGSQAHELGGGSKGGRTLSASRNRFSREHDVGPIVHTILVLRNIDESATSLHPSQALLLDSHALLACASALKCGERRSASAAGKQDVSHGARQVPHLIWGQARRVSSSTRRT